MADFEINKGVGREVEFKGLRAQYLFIFAAGLLTVFVMFVIMGDLCSGGKGASGGDRLSGHEDHRICLQQRPVQ